MALINNLMTYYKLDETTGDVKDELDNFNGTSYNTTRGVTGILGNAFEFSEASDSYIDTGISSSNDLGEGDPVTISMWINPSTFSGYNYFLSDNEYGTGADIQFGFTQDDKDPYVNIWGALAYAGEDLSTDTWYHIVGVYDGSKTLMYLNGTYKNETTDYSSSGTTKNLYIGKSPGWDRNFDGKIDEVGIWKRALTSTEISNLYNNGNGLRYSSFRIQPETAGILNIAKIKGVPKFLQVSKKEAEGELKLEGGEIRPLNPNQTFEYSTTEKTKTTTTYTTLISAYHKSNTGKVVITAVTPWLATGLYADASFKLTQSDTDINGTESLNNWATGDGQVNYTTQGYYEPKKGEYITYALKWKQGASESDIVTGGTFGAYNIFIQDII